MEMHLWQALLLGLFCWLSGSKIYGGWIGDTIMGKPLISSAICGMIMGDVASGIKIGCVIQAAYIGATVVGGVSSLPSIGTSIWFAVPLAIIAGGDAAVALGICVPFAPVNTLYGNLQDMISIWLLHISDTFIEKRKFKTAGWILYCNQVAKFIGCMLIVPTCCMLGATFITDFIKAVPDWVNGSIKAFMSLLPLLGFMLIMRMIVNNKVELILFVAGFVAKKVIGLNVMTVTIIMLAVAYLYYLARSASIKEEE